MMITVGCAWFMEKIIKIAAVTVQTKYFPLDSVKTRRRAQTLSDFIFI